MMTINEFSIAYSRMTAVESKLVTILSFFVLTWNESAVGMLILSPVTVAPVCQVGDPLQITCTASVEYISWSIFRVNEQGTLEKEFNDEIINSIDLNQMTQTRVNSALFTFTRTSAQFASPLISTLSIDSVNSDLNGAVVNCVDIRNMTTSASTTIQIIDTSQNIQYTPTLGISEEHYEADNVTVTVEWIQQQGVTYIVEVSPFVPKTNLIESARYQLTIPYNSTYNLSVVATTPCRRNATAFITLHYANCGHPALMPVCTMSCSTDSIPRVVGYNDIIPVEGRTITFSCPPGLELIGPNSATCTENGEWGPDLRGIMCNNSAEKIPESSTTHTQQSMNSELVAAVLSTVFIFLVISAFTFVIGFMGGLYVGRNFKRELSKETPQVTAADHPKEQPHQIPFYEDVLTETANQQEQNLKLKENVAYQPSKPTVVEIN